MHRTHSRYAVALAGALTLAGCGGLGLWSSPSETTSSSSGSTGSATNGSSGTTSTGNTSATTTGGSTSASTTTGTTTSSATSSTTTSGSTGSTGSCNGTAPPAIHCVRADGASSWFVTGESPQIACTVDPGLSPESWSGSTDPAYFSVDARSAPGNIFVGLPATNLPVGFGDTQVAVTISASFCSGAASTSDVVHIPVVGNTLAADHWDGNVKVFASGGQSLGLFGSAVVTGNPNMVAVLDDGNVLVGGSTQLVKLDRTGAKLADFDLLDHNGNSLFPDCGSGCTTEPWGAANASDGSVWVSASHGRGATGFLYRFTANGQYLDTVPAVQPPSGSGGWEPLGIARRADGTMVVSSGYEHDPAYVVFFPSGSTTGSYHGVSIPNCTAGADGGAGSCSANSAAEAGLSGVQIDPDGTMFVTNIWMFDDDGDIAAYDASTLNFKRATYHPTSGLDPMYNQWLRGITRAGDWLLVAVWNGCVWAVDPQSLEPMPQGRGVDQNGCIAGGNSSIIDLRAVAHFSSNP